MCANVATYLLWLLYHPLSSLDSARFRIRCFAENGRSFRFPHRLWGCSPSQYFSIFTDDPFVRICDSRRVFCKMMVAVGWEISIRHEADSGMPSGRSRDPRRFRVMLAIGWASVLRGTKRWRDEQRNETIERRRGEVLRGSRKRTVARPVAN